MSARMHDRILLACDVNQDLTQDLDTFARQALTLLILDVIHGSEEALQRKLSFSSSVLAFGPLRSGSDSLLEVSFL